ncbi:RNA-binding protein 1-like [Nicotiana sylvestris]
MENTVKQGKIFIGGISWETTEETLRKHFSRYGEVIKSEIPKVWETGFGKGFGFVTFADSSVFDELLQDQHIILGRTVDVSLARPKGENSQSQRCLECRQTSKSHRKKIFVWGLPQYLSEEDFKRYFEHFGKIEDAKIIYDRETNTPRGFGFITYDSEEAVTNVLQRRFHVLNNKFVEVKKAMPKEKRVMDTCTYTSYPTNSGYVLVPVLNSNEIYAPNYNYYMVNPAMVPCQSIPFNYSGTDMSVSQSAQIQCYTPRHPVNYYASTPNGVDNGGSYEALSNTPRCPVNGYASTPDGVDNKGSYETLSNAAKCPISTPNGVHSKGFYETLSNAARCQVNCYASASNGVDNGGSSTALSNGVYNSDVEHQIDVKCSNGSDCGTDKSVSHEGNHQDCNIEVQLVGNVSPPGKSGLFSIRFTCEFNYSVIKSLKNNSTVNHS